MRKYLFPVILCLLFLVLPLNVYIISGNLGTGVQGALYRYQLTDYGQYFSTIGGDLQNINSVYTGKTAYSIISWFLGGVVLGLITLVSLLTIREQEKVSMGIYSGFLFLSGILFIVSAAFQYGVLFNGPAGITLPFGAFLEFLLAMGILFYPRDFFPASDT